MTRKLFWEAPTNFDFQAEVVELGTDNGKSFIVLDRSAFYPTGGGQPSDNGWIEGVQIFEVIIEDDGTIRHFFEGDSGLIPGSTVRCKVNEARRRDHTQQHSGQHILSQSFFQLFGAETNGFRIGEKSSEIDLKFDSELSSVDAVICEAVELANSIVFENRIVKSLLVTNEESARLPLRKESTVTEDLRIIEIENFDYSPCGGTHVKQTGEVGIILVKNWTRAKQMLRLEFVCGVRAIREYREVNTITASICKNLSIGREGLVETVATLVESGKAYDKKIKLLTAQLIDSEVEELIRANPLVILKIFDGRPFEELRFLASKLISQAPIIALLATINGGKCQLAFAAAPVSNVNAAELMKEICEKFGGKGGGTPSMAQGGVSKTEELENYLKDLSTRLEFKI